jgi:hypothetical protein
LLFITIIAFGARGILARECPNTFGDQQLIQILNDRPSMKGIICADDFVCRWVVKQFNARSLLDRIYWDPREPHSDRPAEHRSAYLVSPAYVRVTSAETISGRDKWLLLVFELHNIQNEKLFNDLDRKAVVGKIDRDHYSNECVALEFQALVETQMFFKRHPIPGATTKNDPYYTSYLNGSGNFDDYKKMLDSDDAEAYDPRDYFGKQFDRLQKGSTRSWTKWWNDLQK